jgi:hypothetical protein
MTANGILSTTPSAVVFHRSGRQYTANSSEQVTFPYPDVAGISAVRPLSFLTGTSRVAPLRQAAVSPYESGHPESLRSHELA